MSREVLIGTWARAGTLVGLVARVDGDEVTLFDPCQRQMSRLAAAEVEPVPAGAVTVTVVVDLPLAHGLDEEDVRRWVASITDPVLRERGLAALAESGIDDGALLPEVRVEVRPAQTTGAVCLCGARTPAPAGSSVGCARCGRQAVTAPVA